MTATAFSPLQCWRHGLALRGPRRSVGFELELSCRRQRGGSRQAKSRCFAGLRKLTSNRHSLLAVATWRRGWDSNPRMEVLQTSPLGRLGTAPFLITQLLTATALPSAPDLLPNLLPNSDQVFPSPEFRKC